MNRTMPNVRAARRGDGSSSACGGCLESRAFADTARRVQETCSEPRRDASKATTLRRRRQLPSQQSGMKITSFRVENYRNLRLAEASDPPDFMVVCGGNGSGKSALLNALIDLTSIAREPDLRDLTALDDVVMSAIRTECGIRPTTCRYSGRELQQHTLRSTTTAAPSS